MNNDLLLLKSVYEDLFSQLNKNSSPAQTRLEFYPYTGISSRIRLREGILHIKISDVLQDAPLELHKALAEILLKKLFKKRVSPAALQIYRNYINQEEIRNKSIETRRARGRKTLKGTQGEFYNLNEIFDLLNQIYFQNALSKPALTWSAAKTYRILGHHDSTHKTLAVSKSLDEKSVPRFVVEYVVYHEMLHIKYPTKYINGRRYNHTPEFKRAEKEFAFFEEADRWIEKNAKNLKRWAQNRK